MDLKASGSAADIRNNHLSSAYSQPDVPVRHGCVSLLCSMLK